MLVRELLVRLLLARQGNADCGVLGYPHFALKHLFHYVPTILLKLNKVTPPLVCACTTLQVLLAIKFLPINMSPTFVSVNRAGIIRLSMQVKNIAFG